MMIIAGVTMLDWLPVEVFVSDPCPDSAILVTTISGAIGYHCLPLIPGGVLPRVVRPHVLEKNRP